MKNKTRLLAIAITFLVIIGAILAVYFYFHIEYTDEFSDYVCVDSHLVSIATKRDIGYYETQVSDSEYRLTYSLIKGHKRDEFLTVSMRHITLFSSCEEHVLNAPGNDTNPLEDWQINEIQIYSIDRRDKRNNQHGPFSRVKAQDYYINTLAISNDEKLIADTKKHILSEDRVNLLKFLEENRSSYDNIREVEFDGSVRIKLRLIFNESKSIVWESEISLYRNKDTGEYVVAVDRNHRDSEYVYKGIPMIIDPQNELYEFIVSNYGN